MRRGQTLILALAILFLLVILGSIFVTTLLRNLTRVTRQGKTDEALTLAMAGLQFASNQFKSSVDGADWRPAPTEPLWRYPGGTVPQRQLDPDYEWLSDSGSFTRPFVRYATGRGRFLLRVTFEPALEAQSALASSGAQVQQNSGMIHIESIGRPGEFDPNDPSFLSDPTSGRGTPSASSYRKVEAYVPVGLLDQLWWITNHTNEPGPASIGTSLIQNPGYDPRYPVSATNQRTLVFPALFEGTIRSNTDVEFYGKNVLRFYGSRGEGLFVKGEVKLAPGSTVGGTATDPDVRIDIMDDGGTGATAGDLEPQTAVPTTLPARPMGTEDQDDDPRNDTRITWRQLRASNDPAFDPVPLVNQGGTPNYVVLDEGHLRSDAIGAARSIRLQGAPLLDQLDVASGIDRWRKLTRDSGDVVLMGTRKVNTGALGLTDRVAARRSFDPTSTVVPAVPADKRAKGLYIDNYDDIQYPKNRPRVKDEWLQRMPTPSWAGDSYTPTIDKTPDHPDRKTPTPIVDILLTSANDASNTLRPVLVVTRFDPDVRQANEPQGTSSDPRLFYNYDSTSNTLSPMGQTRIYDYPENGVVFAEGSIRVRGLSGVGGLNPEPLTIVSGGTIYIEGNLLQMRGGSSPDTVASGWQVSLLAQDNVVLNPTAFTRVTLPHGNVTPPAGDPDDPTVDGFYRMQPGSELDFKFQTASLLDYLGAAFPRWLLHVKHAGGDRTDATSETRVTLNLPSLNVAWPNPASDPYDFAGNPPPPATPVYATANQNFYLFHEISPGATVNWGESSWRYPDREQKTFFLPLTGRLLEGLDNTFRIQNDLSTAANDKDYLLGKVAVLPETGPLPIRIEAVMYAFTGSWFVIPPPFFNDHLDASKQPDPYDSRAYYAQNSGVREDPATYPINTDHYPFYREPLNVDIEVIGAITENMPADPTERARWMSHLWLEDPNYDPSGWKLSDPTKPPQAYSALPTFRPNLRYRYDGDLRRLVRVRNLRTGQERVAWAAPSTARQGGIPTAQSVIASWLADPNAPSYSVTLPVAPKLPASAAFYEGNPL
jgi:hypothetical protein